LGEWFEEKWVDISRPKKGGGFEPCGREDAESGKYPKCVPASKAASMSAADRKSAVRRKRRAESTQTRVGNKPINVATDVEKASKNVPTNKELYARVKAEAKSKFDVYPSAYANAWLVREYKSRGGKYKVEKADSPAWQTKAGKNPKGGLNAKGRASYKRETGGTLRPPVKRGDNPRRASFLARMGNMPGPERDANGEPTRLLLSLQAWGASSKADARKKAKAISARNKVKDDVRKASFASRSEAGRYAANQRWKGQGQKTPTTGTGAKTPKQKYDFSPQDYKMVRDAMPQLSAADAKKLTQYLLDNNAFGDTSEMSNQEMSNEFALYLDDALGRGSSSKPKSKTPTSTGSFIEPGKFPNGKNYEIVFHTTTGLEIEAIDADSGRSMGRNYVYSDDDDEDTQDELESKARKDIKAWADRNSVNLVLEVLS
jgi:hypothetical protein